MATRNIVPRANNEGGLGTVAKQWEEVRARRLYEDGSRVATLDGPTFTQSPLAPTPDPGEDSFVVSTTAWVVEKLLGFIGRVVGFTGQVPILKADGTLETSGYTPANLLDRANHTGTQAAATITGLGDLAAMDDLASILISDSTVVGRNILGSATAADARGFAEAMSQSGLRAETAKTASFAIDSTLLGKLISVGDNLAITVPASGVGPGVVVVRVDAGFVATIAGTLNYASGGAVTSLTEGTHFLIISDANNVVIDKDILTSADITDATDADTASKVAKRDVTGGCAFKTVTISANGSIILGTNAPIQGPSATIFPPTTSGYFAVTANSDGSIDVAIADIAGLTAALAAKADASHSHATSEVTGLDAALAAKASSTHTHPQADITNLVADLAAKSDTGHSHDYTAITGLVAQLAAKAASSHTHAQSDITGLVAALATKSATGHTHSTSEVTGLDAALLAKANASHTHDLVDINDFGAGIATALGINTGLAGAPALIDGVLGTPSSGVATNLTGTASGLTAGNVTTNANLTGHITSVGNAAVLGSFTFAQLNTAVSDADVARTDASNTFTGTQTLSGNLVANGAFVSTPQALSGPGAVNLTTLNTKLTTTGAANALTLADGVDGQEKTIVHEVDGGSAVLTPTTKTGFTTITFTALGDSVTLIFFTTRGWMIKSIYGAVPA